MRTKRASMALANTTMFDIPTIHEPTVKERGQYFTPEPLAHIMTKLSMIRLDSITLLDPGAGRGALSSAYLSELFSRDVKPTSVKVIAIEQDATLIPILIQTLQENQKAAIVAGVSLSFQVICTDFLSFAYSLATPVADIIITNPPYRKIHSDSQERLILSQMGLETSNLYTAFLYAAEKCLVNNGELISITPRSFCNGTYHRAFRQWFLATMSINHIVTIDSRSDIFTHVLQETIIVASTKSTIQPSVTKISTYSSEQHDIVSTCEIPFSQIVYRDDSEYFIRLETEHRHCSITQRMLTLSTRLADLNLQVSTGPVVDFRIKDYLLPSPSPESVPLLYAQNCGKSGITWPLQYSKKPNAVMIHSKTIANLIHNGCYVLLRRFTTREEKRRIVAYVYSGNLPSAYIGLENHLNYFHNNGQPLDPTIAIGLAGYLNSQIVDDYYRLFGGHTQVNATDLRNIPYPRLEQLHQLGCTIMNDSSLDVDLFLQKEVFHDE